MTKCGPIITSLAFHQDGGKWFRVSTIMRESSMPTPTPVLYEETAVFEWHPNSQTPVGKMLLCEGGGLGYHAELCEHLIKHGELPRDRDEEESR